MSMKEIYSKNHIASPLVHFGSQQMQYLLTLIHVFAQELSYRNNVSKYIILHQKHYTFKNVDSYSEKSVSVLWGEGRGEGIYPLHGFILCESTQTHTNWL